MNNSKFENKDFCKKVFVKAYENMVDAFEMGNPEVSMDFAWGLDLSKDDYAAIVAYIKELRGNQFVDIDSFKSRKKQNGDYAKWMVITYNLAELMDEDESEDSIFERLHDYTYTFEARGSEIILKPLDDPWPLSLGHAIEGVENEEAEAA